MTSTDQFCALLDGKGARYTRDGDVVRVPGSLYLTNCTGLTSLPDNLSVDGWLDLADCTGLTALPDNLRVGGSLYLDGCTGLTALPDGLSVGGGLILDDDQCRHITHWRGRAVKLRNVDGYPMVMGRSRQVEGVTVHSARYFETADLAYMRPCYVAEADGLTAHGDTAEQAIRDLRFKSLEHGDLEEIADAIRERGSVRMEEWRAITGACEAGTRHGMEQAGLDPDADELPLPAVLSAAFGSYGDRFKSFFKEARA